MTSHTSNQQFSEQTLRQVAADCRRALHRGHFSAEQSRVERLRCIDDEPETSDDFGRQLWYFEGRAITIDDRRLRVYGVIEYSIQFGLHELVEDGVFESPHERDRFLEIYHHVPNRRVWNHPSMRLLGAGMCIVAVSYLVYITALLFDAS